MGHSPSPIEPKEPGNEAYLPTQQGPPDPQVRLSRPNEDKRRSPCTQEASSEGAESVNRLRREKALLTQPPGGRGSNIPEQGFSKLDRVRKRAGIKKIFAGGARYSCKGMRIHVISNALTTSRAVIVPVHSYPSAVARNRARRVIRECWRLDKSRLSPGCDVAVVLYPGFDRYDERKHQLERLLRQAGLFT